MKLLATCCLATVLLSATLLAYAGCGGVEADAEALWKHITETEPYSEWKPFPGHEGMQSGNAPHGSMHIVYVNDHALPKQGMPDHGAIIVKENYSDTKELAAITVMYKVKDYNPEAGDWFWVKYDVDGTAAKSGKVGGCIGCHGAVADNGFVFLHPYK